MVVGILSRRRSLYTTRRLAESALQLGHEARVLNPLHCVLVLSPLAPEIYYRGLESRVSDLDVVLPRIGASITEHGLAVVNQFDMMGVPLVNNSQPIARSRDKLRSLQLLSRAGIDIPKTVMASDPSARSRWRARAVAPGRGAPRRSLERRRASRAILSAPAARVRFDGLEPSKWDATTRSTMKPTVTRHFAAGCIYRAS